MLACRPMLPFALAVMAGAASGRLCPELAIYLPYGLPFCIILSLWFIRTPVRTAPAIETLPEQYAPHIIPTPGYFAARGLNRFILLCCCGLFLLGVWRQNSWELVLSPDALPVEKTVTVSMTACQPTYQFHGKTGNWQIPALVTSVEGEPCRPFRVMLSGRDGTRFSRGDGLVAKVRRPAPRPKLYPGAFDSALWLERDGIGATVWVVRDSVIVVPAASFSLATMAGRALDEVRGKAIANTLHYGGDEGPALATMLYGYRDALSEEVRDAFRRVGIGHVLAISGLHVGLIVGLLWWLTGWINWSGRWRAIACLVLALVYLGLSGGQVAAQRATLMAGIYLAGIAWGRRSDMLNSLGAAAFIITLANPSAPFDVSFQLSFTAVVFIHMAIYVPRTADMPRPRAAERGSRRYRFRKNLSSLVWLSVATWFGLFPIIAAVFNQVNLIGLPINIVVIPLMSFVLQGGLLLPWIGWISGFAWLACFPARMLTWLALNADAVPYASFPAHAPSPVWTAVFYLVVFCWLCRGMIKTYARQRIYSRIAGGVLAIAFVGVVATMGSAPPPEQGRLTVLSGRGMPLVVAEGKEGGIALIGALSKSGLTETGWLHVQRRNGLIATVLVGDEPSIPAALPYHFLQGVATAIPLIADFSDADRGWQPVPGAEEIEYAVSRDGKGRLAWIAARTDGKSVVIAQQLAERQFTWRLERKIAGHDADLFVLGKRALIRPTPDTCQAGWFDRWRWGSLAVTNTIYGFDGAEWLSVDKK